MDNIIFEKIWQDDNLIELRIAANCEFVSAYQNCYIELQRLKEISEKITTYLNDSSTSCYLEFGQKEGNYTPAFSMCILPSDLTGHVKIEVDIEIADNNERAHRCCFYVKSDMGLIDNLNVGLKRLAVELEGTKISLH